MQRLFVGGSISTWIYIFFFRMRESPIQRVNRRILMDEDSYFYVPRPSPFIQVRYFPNNTHNGSAVCSMAVLLGNGRPVIIGDRKHLCRHHGYGEWPLVWDESEAAHLQSRKKGCSYISGWGSCNSIFLPWGSAKWHHGEDKCSKLPK